MEIHLTIAVHSVMNFKVKIAPSFLVNVVLVVPST